MSIAVPPELIEILQLAALNPATLGVGYFMGRRSDQRGKVVVVALAAAIAGTVFAVLLKLVGVIDTPARLYSGIFVASCVFGAVWGAIGYAVAQARRTGGN